MAALHHLRTRTNTMNPSRFLPLAIASLLAIPAAHASVDLIAVDGLSANMPDLSTETAAPLENGAPGNQLGGIGSGLAYAGGNTFLAIPDRGPNAVSYNSAVSDTDSYINRFQTISMTLAPSAAGSALPFALTPTLTGTTLLRTARALAYGDGVSAGLPNGEPALNNVHHTHYFTGRSDNFDPTRLSTNPFDARFDPESIRVSNDGSNVFVSDEYGPYIYRFNRKTGERTGIYSVPEISMVGYSEEYLTQHKIPYEVGLARYAELAKGQMLGDDQGLLKILFDPTSLKVLGVHAIGERAAEIIHIGQAVMALNGSIEYFRDTIFNYPTLAEAYKVAALDGLNKL